MHTPSKHLDVHCMRCSPSFSYLFWLHCSLAQHTWQKCWSCWTISKEHYHNKHAVSIAGLIRFLPVLYYPVPFIYLSWVHAAALLWFLCWHPPADCVMGCQWEGMLDVDISRKKDRESGGIMSCVGTMDRLIQYFLPPNKMTKLFSQYHVTGELFLLFWPPISHPYLTFWHTFTTCAI